MKNLRVAHQLAFDLDSSAGAFRPTHADLREIVEAAFEGFIGNKQTTDIEPYLVDLGYVRYIAAGREITAAGRRYLEKYEEKNEH